MPDIKKYENMAMLELPDDEREALGERLGAITDSFIDLEQYDTGGIEPLVTVLELCNIMREDIPARLMHRDELLANAPEQQDGYFRVPGILS